jgi:hypothetical protein
MVIQVNVHLQEPFPSVLDKRPSLSHHKSVKNGTISYKGRWFRQLYRLGERGIHTLAVLVVIELGFLSPLSCVIHCFIHDLLRERNSAGVFLCNVPSSSTTLDHELPTSSPIETVRPRAVFETLPPAPPTALVIIVVILLFLLSYPSLLPRLSGAPPTPPPRIFPLFLTA